LHQALSETDHTEEEAFNFLLKMKPVRKQIRIAGGIKLAEMVVENLRDAADDLVDVWIELDGSVENVLVRSEAERDALNLNRMANRLEKKIKDQLKAIGPTYK